ncbi:zinc finger BED domain-containing protein RICESLEEPER 2-like [Senna tora]|uniref:Zinc finger BED domain-containing protein RICESLEEPER 2-like n=1 Tax=Senna tora TaxID=362788 RepID=A0A834WHM0_9FABA|nr:zinc finger BED domain-containing protein RICESLEEPER 2-like [Senna tora]
MKKIKTTDGYKVQCMHCGKLMSAFGGTSHLRRHLLTCPKRPSDLENEQHRAIEADEVALCLREWGIDNKIFSITLDNASYNDVMVNSLKQRLSINRTLLCDGALFQVRCCSHILNLIVQAGMKVADETISKVQHWGRRNVAFKNFVLSKEEWEKVQILHRFLKVFYDVTCKFSGSKYPTSNLYFRGVRKATSAPPMTSASCSASNYLYETNDDSSDQDYEDFLKSRSSQSEITELAQYLHEGNLAIHTEIDILDYWKKASGQFPILASMARDILAIPISTQDGLKSDSTLAFTLAPVANS